MTKETWLEKVTNEADKLRDLIGRYHPQRKPPLTMEQKDLVYEDVTAPSAELACENVRDSIREQFQKEGLGDPTQIFSQALEKGDATIIYLLLDQTWFGVPETTACWNFTGFREAVDLIEDFHELDLQVDGESDLSNGDHERDLGKHGR